MKKEKIFFMLFLFFVLTIFSCKKENLFTQPTIEITGFSLKELPGEYTYLDVDMIVTNNDKREAHIADVEYQVVIEEINSENQEFVIDKDILKDTPLELTLPLKLKTSDAIKLLAKLDAGEELKYVATGTFHADDPVLNLFDLPINVSGTAFVETGFDDFYIQPKVIVNGISGNYILNGNSTYTFNFDVNCAIQNMDTNSVKINNVEYVVYIEGIKSDALLYSSEISINGNGTISLTLPILMNLSSADADLLIQAITDGTIDYSVEGTFHVTEVNQAALDFYLPLSVSGNVSADIIETLFNQPTIEVTGYTLQELPGEFAYLDIDMKITNNDTKQADIADVTYIVAIEGVSSLEEQSEINQTLLVGTPLEITLPLTLLTNDAIQLLSILDAGELLDYVVTGTFHIDDPILNQLDLPIDISGSASVEVGFENFYEQPEITVGNFTYNFSINGFTSYTFNLDVNTTVQNIDTRNVIIDEVEYVVFVEGVESNTHWYSDYYNTDIVINGGQTIPLTLPVTLVLSPSNGASLVSKMSDGTVDYIIEGTFHAIDVDGNATNFSLPLYDTGNVPAIPNK